MVQKNNKKKKKKNQLPFRLNILFLAVFMAFSILILRLGVVQIVKGEQYVNKLQKTQEVTAKKDQPRGKIFGRQGKLLVDNKPKNAIIFTRRANVDQEKTLEMAQKIASYIELSDDQIGPLPLRDKKDYYILTHPNIKEKKLSNKELQQEDYYDQLLEKVSEKEIEKALTPKDLEIIAIKRELDMSSNLTPHIVVRGLTAKERGTVAGHLDAFDGMISVDLVASRVYPHGKPFYLGEIGKIPKMQIDNYLAKGYDRNDIVGTSYLEKQYENLLSGIPTKLIYETYNNMPVGTPEQVMGSRGYDLRLTVNLQLQKQIGQIIEEELQQEMAKSYNDELDSAYVVMMNPNTGAILALAGREYHPETGKFVDASWGTVLKAFEMGSTVKGATVLAGYQSNTIPGVILDKPIHFPAGLTTFSSYTSRIPYVGPKEALQWSSNVYMGIIAANMASFSIDSVPGHYQVYNMGTGKRFAKGFNTLRDVYGQFGLGVSTGVDIPSETLGSQGSLPDEGFGGVITPGKILQFAIGQYDTYSPLMLAQYVSTIANGGYRIAPHFLKSVHVPENHKNGKLGPKVYEYEPKILNHVNNTPEEIDIVQEGFRMVAQTANGTGTPLSMGEYAKYKIAAKTGTAQVKLREIKGDLTNSTLIAYAPYDNPQVAISVVVPKVVKGSANVDIGKRVIKSFFELKEPGNGNTEE